LEIVHKILLAGVGAVALAQSEIELFVERLVERGELAEKDGKALVSDILDQQRRQNRQRAGDRTGDEVSAARQLPDSQDIQALSERISQISNKVDQLLESSQNKGEDHS
jgi:polyhydroxyalkanoate synthesis regulator phasin